MSDADDDRYKIRARLDAAGRTQAELARALGMDPSLLLRTIKGRRVLKAHEMIAIDHFFDEDGDGQDIQPYSPSARDRKAPARIPIFGYAVAGNGGRVAFNEGKVVEWIEPPPFNLTGGEFFGVRVVNDSMEPRYFAGEYAIAQRSLPPVRNRDCLVEFHDGSGVLKTYKSEKGGVIFCHQWNPDEEVRYDGATVKALHAIVWRR